MCKKRKAYPSDITRTQFEVIRADLEGATKTTRPRKYDLYDIFCAVLYLLKEGCSWRAIPHGIKIHIATDILGLPHAIMITAAKRNELHTFAVIPKRWVVERSFGWLDKCRRLWKNCERKLQNTFQMVTLAFVRLILRRY